MKITFLGTSHGYPEKGRVVSCTMVETGGKIYIIDAGSAVDEHLVEQDADFSAVRAVFITHMHSDHVNGLLSLHEEFLSYRYNDQTVLLSSRGRRLGRLSGICKNHTSGSRRNMQNR